MSNNNFINLNRTFHVLLTDNIQSDDVDISNASGTGQNVTWDELAKEYRVVILSEAGSGKTTEIRHMTKTLRDNGKAAFFLRLENIANDIEIAFELGDYREFKEWLASLEEGWIFLDSVDEACLRHPRDFDNAIRKLSKKEISHAMSRTHIVITSRETAWLPKSHLNLCNELFPYGSEQTQNNSFKVVSFNNLDRGQVSIFAHCKGISNAQDFLNSIERMDAWPFTTRPQDLTELAEFWIAKGRIGTHTAIIQNSIDRRLIEADSTRDSIYPLSINRAREGVRLLAAATTLTQESAIRVPDRGNLKGISAKDILPDWDKEITPLLLRPIFDDEIYGAVRFHHRTVREYLTSEWFVELLKKQTSRRMIESLFFRNQYGLDIIVPKLRPVLTWLILVDERIRNKACKIAPEILFECGDPSRLPLDIRRYMLNSVCDKIARGTGRAIHNYDAIQRVVDVNLSCDIKQLINKYEKNDNVIGFLLHIVWIGQFHDLASEVMKIALNPNAENYVRIFAFRAMAIISSENNKECVRNSFLNESFCLKINWLAELIDGMLLTPKTLKWLLACLAKTMLKQKYTSDNLVHNLNELISNADISFMHTLISGFNKLLSLSPVIERGNCEVSSKYQWLTGPSAKAIEKLILAQHSASLQTNTLETLSKISAMQGYDGSNYDSKVDFAKLVQSWPKLNQTLFWFEVEKSRAYLNKKREQRLTQHWQASPWRAFYNFEAKDFNYVIAQISNQEQLDNKLVALSLAYALYNKAERPQAWLEELKVYTADNNELSMVLESYLNPIETEETKRFRKDETKWKKRTEQSRKKEEAFHQGWKEYFTHNLDKAKAALNNSPKKLTSDLLYLFDKLKEEQNNSGRCSEYNWHALIPNYGEDAARFYRDGVVDFWRSHIPVTANVKMTL